MKTQSYGELISRGHSPNLIRSKVRSGEWTRLRRGGYLTSAGEVTPEADHLRLLAATWPQLRLQGVVSHVSAGVLWQLPVPRGLLSRVHVSRYQPSGARRNAQLHIHASRFEPEELTALQGYRVTTLARTVIDLICMCHPSDSLMIVDAALRQGLDLTLLDEQLLAAAGRHGIAAARWAVAHGDGLREQDHRARIAQTRPRSLMRLSWGLRPPNATTLANARPGAGPAT